MITVLHLRNRVTGQPYRKTLQYGFCLQGRIDEMAGRTRPLWRKPEWKEKQLQAEREIDMYACGFLPPNYPVPAIRYEVEYTYDPCFGSEVIIWDERNPLEFECAAIVSDY